MTKQGTVGSMVDCHHVHYVRSVVDSSISVAYDGV